MKLDWTVKGKIVYRDQTPDEDFTGTWPGLTYDEADLRAEELVANEMRRRKVHGVSIVATAKGKGGLSLVQRLHLK